MDVPAPLEIPVVWTTSDDLPILFANQFVVQFHEDEFTLTVGQFQPPMLLGTVEEKREQAAKIGQVSIRVLARFAMSRTRAGQLAKLLTDSVSRYDAQKDTE